MCPDLIISYKRREGTHTMVPVDNYAISCAVILITGKSLELRTVVVLFLLFLKSEVNSWIQDCRWHSSHPASYVQ